MRQVTKQEEENEMYCKDQMGRDIHCEDCGGPTSYCLSVCEECHRLRWAETKRLAALYRKAQRRITA